MRKSSPGFTLFELIVAIASAAMVLVIALSFLLLGMRMENRSSTTASQLQTARIVLTMAEKLAVSGDIKRVEYIGDDEEGSSWVLYDKDGQYLLQYLASDGTLRLGDSILMYDLKSASAALSNDGKLFTFSLETQEDEFSTTVYCRNNEISSNQVTESSLLSATGRDADFKSNTAYTGRLAFLTALCRQYGSSGEIIGHVKTDAEPWEYFSEWYIHQQDAGYEGTDWNKDTPWCACFVSWAANEINGSEYLQSVPYFANVGKGIEYFKGIGHWHEKTASSVPVPDPGDLIFFDWDKDAEPDHVGAVLHIREEGYLKVIYTVEGNSSGKVKVNRYPANSDCIIGYGVLEWNMDHAD